MQPNTKYPFALTPVASENPRQSPSDPTKPVRFMLIICDLAGAREFQNLVNAQVKLPRYAELAQAGKIVHQYAPPLEVTEAARRDVMVANYDDIGIDDTDMRRRRRVVRAACMMAEWGVPTPVGVQELRDLAAAAVVRLQPLPLNPQHCANVAEELSEEALLALAEIVDIQYQEPPRTRGPSAWSDRLREVRDQIIHRWTRWAAQLKREAAHRASTRPVGGATGGMRSERSSTPAFAPVYAS